MTAILSFFMSSAFRMIFGEIASYFNKRQDHVHEIERMSKQGELDAAQHARNLEAIKVQAEMQVQTIRVQGEADLQKTDAVGFYEAAAQAMKPIGIWWVDAWNGVIRPLGATMALILWGIALFSTDWKMTEWDRELVSGILGLFFADRLMRQRGK